MLTILLQVHTYLQVNRALRAFDTLESLADLATVDEDADQYNAERHNRIFVAEEIEDLLSIACKHLLCVTATVLLINSCYLDVKRVKVEYCTAVPDCKSSGLHLACSAHVKATLW